MKLKNDTYYHFNKIDKVIIIGINKYSSKLVLIAPEDDQKIDWMCKMGSFYINNFEIKDRYKNKKFVFAVHKSNLTKL